MRLTHSRWAVLTLINYVAFIVMTFVLGGDAFNGLHFNAPDHYFLALHGQPNEVSLAVWLYSWAHMASVALTLTMAFVTMGRRRHVD